ncbi:hypothetical protein ACFSSA_15150 [Luteolibacter algae]|uniref:CcmD family protein n=1 Tax=Luteolibacter algae TaxID=454151 RepID=A0ABW5DDB6_9BACT
MIQFFNSLACSTCRVSMVEGGGDAAGYSIFALLVVILAVLGGVGFFMLRIARRENENLDPELRDDFVHQ